MSNATQASCIQQVLGLVSGRDAEILVTIAIMFLSVFRELQMDNSLKQLTPLTTTAPQRNQDKIGETHITKENGEEKTGK
jgi:hypothetical protein